MADEQNFTFHHDPEERLRRRPELRDFHEGKMLPTRGLFRVLLATPGGKFLLMAIGILVIANIGLALAASDSATGEIVGVKCRIAAFDYDGEIYVTLALSGEKSAETLSFEAQFFAIDENGDVIETQDGQTFFSGGEEKIRVKFVSAQTKQVKAVLSCEENTASVVTKVASN